MYVIPEERWAEHEAYVEKYFPGRVSDRKHFGHMIPKDPKPENYCSPCCGALVSYSTSGCYCCCICYECGDFLGCANNNPGLWEAFEKTAQGIRVPWKKPNIEDEIGLDWWVI